MGRSKEMEQIEVALNSICVNAIEKSGVILIEASPGCGKSSIVKRAKKMGKGRVKSATGNATRIESMHDFYAFRQIMESFTGLRPGMRLNEAQKVLNSYKSEMSPGKLLNALMEILPFLGEIVGLVNKKMEPPSFQDVGKAVMCIFKGMFVFGICIPLIVIPLDTIPLDTIPLDTIPLDTIPLDTIPLDTIPLDTIPLDTIPLDTIPLDTIPLVITSITPHTHLC